MKSTDAVMTSQPVIAVLPAGNVDMTVPLFRDIGWIPRMLSAPEPGASAKVALASKPNPTHGGLTVNFNLAADETVELVLFDVSGRQVRELAKGRFNAGPNQVAWDGRDSRGRTAPPGVYLARLKGARTSATHSIVVVD